ncbi:MAG: hypothetical protein KDC09_15075 [Bacteroidales bacterium]|nr:hypothetical protein [Bacteroidales bacterium]
MKRKKNRNQKNQNLKVIAAQYRKDFLAKTRWYFEEWSENNLFLKLPPEEVDTLYKIHFTAPRIEPVADYFPDKKLLKQIKSTLEYWLHLYKVKIAEDIAEIPLNHYCTYYLTIVNYLHTIKDNNQFKGAGIIREKFDRVLQDYDKTVKSASDMQVRIAQMVGTFFSRPDLSYIWFAVDAKVNVGNRSGSYIIFKIRSEKPVVKYFEIKGDRRPGFLLGFPRVTTGVDWRKIKLPSIKAFSYTNKVPVYVQSHALIRLKERLDILKDIDIYYHFFFSIFNSSPLYHHNEWFFPMKLGDVVIGYFTGQLVDGALVLKTFLFVTNEGTPEAERLTEIAGLAKLDIKYWKIDTLRNFFESDISKNEHIRNIFEEAGCGGLFRIQVDDPEKAYSGEVKIAAELQAYLGLLEESEIKDES